MVQGAFNTGTDRIELYTESYAKDYNVNKSIAISPDTQLRGFLKLFRKFINYNYTLGLLL